MIAPARETAPRLVVFNHKGGVGKTTLTVNLAAALAKSGVRVLLVDADPQANSTSYLIQDDVVNSLLDESDGDSGATIWSAMKPVVDGVGDIKEIEPIERFDNLFVLPGDIRLAEFESHLSTFWSECFQRRVRGFRGTSALSQLVDRAARSMSADVVLYDSGPNIGALNRVILLDCDYFMVPAAADLFSLRAIKTLGHVLHDWIAEWRTVSQLAPDGVPLLPGCPRLIGYMPQRFRVYAGRPASNYATLFPRIERAVKEDLMAVLSALDPELVEAAVAPLVIGEIKDFGSLANDSQQQGVPMWLANAGTDEQRNAALASFTELATNVMNRVRQRP